MSVKIPKRWDGTGPYSFAVNILWADSTGCDEIGYYFAAKAETMKDSVCEVVLNKYWF